MVNTFSLDLIDVRDVTTVINDESTLANQSSLEASQGDKRSSEYSN